MLVLWRNWLIGAWQKLSAAHKRLLAALACYAILLAAALYALLPARTSDERFLLGIVLLVFIIFVVKTVARREETAD